MEVLIPILGIAMQLAFFGAIAWVIIRLVGHRRDAGEEPEVDRATSVRRLFVYGLMLVTLILGAVGATMIGLTLLTSGWSDDERTAFSLGLAFMLVAGPAYVFLLRFARGRLRDDDGERTSVAWAAYLNTALASSLIVSVVMANNFLEGVFGVDDFEWSHIAPVIVWAAVWAMHWFWLRPAHGLPGDLHLAVGSLTGLVTMTIGVGGVAYVAGDEIYASVVERLPAGHESPELATWLIAAGVGAVVWAWHWLGCYLRAERTSLWHVYVLLIGTLGGLVAAIASGATITYWTAVWYLGNPKMDLPSEHFEYVPVAVGFLVAGMAAWFYHRTVLQISGSVERSEPIRSYDYLMAASGLVATVIGVALALVALFESIAAQITGDPSEVANRLILAAILGVIGVPLWWTSWSRIGGHREADPTAEIGSLSRRLYLVVLFGAGGLTALISLIVVLFVGIEDLLDGTFGGETLDSARVGLALLATVTGVAWYHLGVFRSDRAVAEQLAPAPAPLPPPVPVSPPATHVVLIAPPGGGLAEALAAATGASVDTWVREDDMPMPDIDIDELVARILEDAGHEVAVVVGPTGADVIPYVT
jgi:hypothetical protein